jgi:hypothetical protein
MERIILGRAGTSRAIEPISVRVQPKRKRKGEMQRTDYQASGPALTPYQSKIRGALERIATLEPEPECCVSETALIVMSATPGDPQDCRNLYRTAFELLTDRGYCRREYVHWRFKRRFTMSDVAGVLAWSGKWKSARAEQAEIHR